ncbi:hypothetical protein IAG44_11795 [Streptomyces roseirectus]|uniref:Uncharacterized protein n=1 Tax=Streptomyces roseirectus TaxID=2768066 RepID=A0A7H0IB98_9ACTN|nr:hypothetical protein [Streptomyces roseirectus]QNP70064.1 hypothetical protein IAG44_11795 [Streptomyces roseirectus]
MDTELATLAASAANALVGALTTETWERARTLLARLRRTPDTERLALELARDRELLLADPADEANRADLTAAWRLRFRRLMADDPDAARALLELVAELAPRARQSGVSFHAESHDTSRIYQSAGDMNIGRTPKP